MQVLFRSQFKDLQEKESYTRQDTTQPAWICILFLSPNPLLLRERICRSEPACSATSLIAEVGLLQYEMNQATLIPVLLPLGQQKSAISKAT